MGEGTMSGEQEIKRHLDSNVGFSNCKKSLHMLPRGYCCCLGPEPCSALCDPMGYTPPDSSVLGISQARTRVGCHPLLQGILLIKGLNSCLLHCRQILYHCITWEDLPQRCKVVQFSHSVVSDSLRPCGLQNARLLCRPQTPRVNSNSCP